MKMKKLMFVMAVVCAALASQAAVVDWTVQYKSSTSAWSDGTPAAGSIVYAFLASDAEAVTTALAGKDAATVAANFAALTVPNSSKATTGPYGVLTGGKIDNDSLVDGSKYDIFLVAFDAASIAAATEYLVSGTQSGTAYTALTPGNKVVATWNNTAPVTGKWTPIGGGIPEPTSGLLLVIGGAMLALRRRRA